MNNELLTLKISPDTAAELKLFDKYREQCLAMIKSGAFDSKDAQIIINFNSNGKMINIGRKLDRFAMIYFFKP